MMNETAVSPAIVCLRQCNRMTDIKSVRVLNYDKLSQRNYEMPWEHLEMHSWDSLNTLECKIKSILRQKAIIL